MGQPFYSMVYDGLLLFMTCKKTAVDGHIYGLSQGGGGTRIPYLGWGEGGGSDREKKFDMSTKTSAYRTSAGSVLQKVLVTLLG